MVLLVFKQESYEICPTQKLYIKFFNVFLFYKIICDLLVVPFKRPISFWIASFFGSIFCCTWVPFLVIFLHLTITKFILYKTLATTSSTYQVKEFPTGCFISKGEATNFFQNFELSVPKLHNFSVFKFLADEVAVDPKILPNETFGPNCPPSVAVCNWNKKQKSYGTLQLVIQNFDKNWLHSFEMKQSVRNPFTWDDKCIKRKRKICWRHDNIINELRKKIQQIKNILAHTKKRIFLLQTKTMIS